MNEQIGAKNNSRIVWIDYMSGIGTLMVFMQHSCVPVITRLILGFHMPLFFWISGFLYQQNGSYRKPFGKYLISRIKRLMIPYLIWFAIGKSQAFLMRGVGQPLLFGQEVVKSFVYCTSWFLPCLFLSELVFHFLNKGIVKWKGRGGAVSAVCAVLFWGCSAVENMLNPERVVFCLDTCLMALGFMFAGAVSVSLIDRLREQKNWTSVIEAAGFAVVGTVCVLLNSQGDTNFMMYQNQYGNYLYAITGAMCLIFALYFAVKAFDGYLPKKYLLYLRDNGILLFLIHFSIIDMTKRLFPMLNHTSLWISSVVCLIAIHVVGIPVCYMVNQWCPVLAGRNSNRAMRGN